MRDYPEGCQVNKWSIYELWDYLRDHDGIDPMPFWEGVKDVVIKTLLCGHENIDRMVKASVGSTYNNYNLLGLDIFIDTDLNPYLLEVNTIPSLFINQISKEIDTRLKAPLIAETLNICGHHISTGVGSRHKADIVNSYLPGYVGKTVGYDHRMYCKVRTEAEEAKQAKFCNGLNGVMNDEGNEDEVEEEEGEEDEEEEEDIDEEDESEYELTDESEASSEEKSEEKYSPTHTKPSLDILNNLTPCDVRVLLTSEEELTQMETFERIFPRPDTGHYLEYTSSTNYYDLLLSAWETKYAGCREEGRQRLRELAEQKVHLQVPEAEKKIKIQHRSPKLFKKSNFIIPHIFNKK